MPTPTAQVLLRGTLFGWGVSLALHVSSMIALFAATTVPPPVFELTFPIEVELGMTEATEVSAEAAPPPSEASEGSGGTGPGGGLDGSVSADAGVSMDPDAGRRRRRDAGVDAGLAIAAGSGEGAGGDGDSPVAFLPAGAQVALRADLDLARVSPVRTEIEQLLAALPDWQILLGSSGAIEPVRDFSRVLIATPNFDRSRLVVAGRLAEGESTPRELADRLALARGASLAWSEDDGIPRAAWNVDATPRTLAIVGPRHFVVARDEDLPRVLQIAAARVEASPDHPELAEVAADALLSMRPSEALSLEIEGAAHFVRPGSTNCPVPESLRAALTVLAENRGVGLDIEATFADDATATEAASCFSDLRDFYASNAFVSGLGFSGILEDTAIGTDGRLGTAHGTITYPQLRIILGLVRSILPRRRGPARAPDPVPAPEPPPG
jgi:hypothetical protein